MKAPVAALRFSSLIRSVTPEVLKKLRPHVVALPENTPLNPNTATAETTGPMQQPAATFANNYDTAYDFWDVDTGLTATDSLGAFEWACFVKDGQAWITSSAVSTKRILVPTGSTSWLSTSSR